MDGVLSVEKEVMLPQSLRERLWGFFVSQVINLPKDAMNRMKSPLYVCIVLVVLLALTSCFKEERTPPVEDTLKKVVTRYNYALIDAYGRQIYDTLREVTSPDELRRVGIIVSSYYQADQIMESRLHKLLFKKVDVNGNRATVDTVEDWSYRWINYKNGEVVEPLKQIHYRMRYHLIKDREKGWVVDRVEEIEHRLKESSSRVER